MMGGGMMQQGGPGLGRGGPRTFLPSRPRYDWTWTPRPPRKHTRFQDPYRLGIRTSWPKGHMGLLERWERLAGHIDPKGAKGSTWGPDKAQAILGLRAVLKRLPSREQTVMTLSYGLEDGQHHTLQDIGKEFGVTKERVRQLQATALHRLRHKSRKKLIAPALAWEKS